MKDIDPAQNSKFPRMSVQVEGDSSEDEQVSDVDEVVEDEGFDQIEGEGIGSEIEDESDDESKQREELEQYADDVFDEEGDEKDVDMEDEDEEDDVE